MSDRLPDDIRAALGIAEDAIIEPGLTSLPPALPAEGFVGLAMDVPPRPYAPIAIYSSSQGVEAWRSVPAPRFVGLHDEARRLQKYTDGRLTSGVQDIIVRPEDPEQFIFRPGEEEGEGTLLHIRNGELTEHLIRGRMDRGWEGASAALSLAPLRIAAPPFSDLTASTPTEEWLGTEYARVSTNAGAVGQVAAVGLVARLYAPPPELLEPWRGAETVSPRSRAIAWFAALPVEHRERAVVAAARRAEALEEQLPTVEARVIADPKTARSRLASWLRDRDDLESIALLARMTNCPGKAALDAALVSLDEEASEHHSIWLFVESLDDDERLAAVAWQEPESWWGRLAGGGMLDDD